MSIDQRKVGVRSILLKGTALAAMISASPASAQTTKSPPLPDNIKSDDRNVDQASTMQSMTQTAEAPLPPSYVMLDERNVDQVSAVPFFYGPKISIGPKDKGLEYAKFFYGEAWIDGYYIAIERLWDGSVDRDRVLVTASTSREFKTPVNGVRNSAEGDGAVLSEDATSYTLTDRDGTVTVFSKSLAANALAQNDGSTYAVATSITRPTGERTYLTYKRASYVASGKVRYALRIQSVTTNAGYQLKFTYASNTLTATSVADWRRVTNVRGINNSVDYCDPSADVCSGFTQNWPSLSFAETRTGGTTTESVTDAEGRTTVYTRIGTDFWLDQFKIRYPSSSTDNIIYRYGGLYDDDGFMYLIYVSNVNVLGQGEWNYEVTRSIGYHHALVITGPLDFQRIVSISNLMGRATSISDASGQRKLTWYARKLIEEKFPEGNVNTYSYDSRGNVLATSRVAKPGSGLPTVTRSATYAASCVNFATCNKPLTVTDEAGNVTSFHYNANGTPDFTQRPAATPGAPRSEVHYSYTSGQPRVKSASGTLVTLPDVVTLPSGSTTCVSGAWPCAASDQVVTEQGYGTSANLLPQTGTVRSGSGSPSATTGFGYDAIGNLTTLTDPNGRVSTTSYAADRQPLLMVDASPDGGAGTMRTATRFHYNAAGLRDSATRGAYNPATGGLTPSRIEATSYDNALRKVTESVSDGIATTALTQFGYDARGRLECSTVRMNPAAFGSLPASACNLGAEGGFGPDRVTRNVYDGADRIVQVRQAVGTSEESAEATYSYTGNGKREYVVDANGNRAKLEYDGLDRQSRWIFPSNTRAGAYNPVTPANALSSAGGLNLADYEQYGYDARGNRTSLRKRDGQVIGYGYDALNRLTVKDLPGTSVGDVYYGYDLRDLQTYARFGSPGGEGITNAWDALGRMSASTATMGGVSRTLSYQIDANGNRTRTTFPDGLGFDQQFDGMNRATATIQPGGATVVSATYDPQGRLAALAKPGATTGYGYDGTGRLTSQSQGLASNGVTTGFGYNPAGQIVSETRSNDAYAFAGQVNVDRAYATNGLNQYSAAGPASFGYDANGNLTSDGTRNYAYDVENRLVSVSNATSLAYDPLGRLWQVSGPAGTTRFLYDGDQLTAEFDGSGNMLRRYVHGGGVDDPLLWYEGPGLTDRRALMADHQGSIVAVADASGNPVRINTYDEYGIPGVNNLGRFQYTGQAWLPELGMYHYKARIYSPTLGRFLQTDPIGYDDQINLYAYVANDPVNNRDPDGEAIETVWDIANIAMGVASAGANIAAGNYGRAAVDIGGVIVDTAAAIVPGVPGGAGTAIRVARGAERGVEAVRAERRTYQTYTKVNERTGQVYTGRTSGTGTPAQNIARRDAGHHMNRQGYGPARLDRSSTNPQAIRGREQQMIERNGGAQSQGGTSGNRINGISDRNQNGPACRVAANREFGRC